jgi:hypothetical protein
MNTKRTNRRVTLGKGIPSIEPTQLNPDWILPSKDFSFKEILNVNDLLLGRIDQSMEDKLIGRMGIYYTHEILLGGIAMGEGVIRSEHITLDYLRKEPRIYLSYQVDHPSQVIACNNLEDKILKPNNIPYWTNFSREELEKEILKGYGLKKD